MPRQSPAVRSRPRPSKGCPHQAVARSAARENPPPPQRPRAHRPSTNGRRRPARSARAPWRRCRPLAAARPRAGSSRSPRVPRPPPPPGAPRATPLQRRRGARSSGAMQRRHCRGPATACRRCRCRARSPAARRGSARPPPRMHQGLRAAQPGARWRRAENTTSRPATIGANAVPGGSAAAAQACPAALPEPGPHRETCRDRRGTFLRCLPLQPSLPDRKAYCNQQACLPDRKA
mmetsp:Transcript_32757/g.90484  ORF Transcript_32757/g.90484 Transcript_32757/m.90484 type:complete len:234 (+) Transcript_32757:388-1089(+)